MPSIERAKEESITGIATIPKKGWSTPNSEGLKDELCCEDWDPPSSGMAVGVAVSASAVAPMIAADFFIE